MPPKSLSIYRGYTAQQLKDRASIPLAANITVYASYIDCLYIDLVRIRNILGASQWDIIALYQHANVNPWSNFGPILRYVIAETITFIYKNTPNYGDFSGYNHSAVTPGWIDKASTETTLYVNESGTTQVFFNITLGEVDYYAELGVLGICFALYESSTLRMYTIIAIASTTDIVDEIGVTTPTITNNIIFTGKVFFINNTSSFTGSEKIANIPNVDNANIPINVKLPNYIILNGGDFLTNDSTPLEVADCSFNSTVGTFTFPAIHSENSYLEIIVSIRLINIQTGLVDEEIIFSGVYTAYDTISGAIIYLTGAGGPPYSGYGYTFEMLIEESGI